jgi:hypothetical protein
MEYSIDAEDRLVAVSDDWATFATANQAPDLARSAVLGTPLWDHVDDLATRELYRKLIRRARAGHELRFRVRCDSPTARRVLELTLSPQGDGGVRFHAAVLTSEDRERVELLSRETARSDDWLTLCSWCNRVRLPTRRWVEVEEAVVALGLLEGGPLPDLTHGMCEDCDERIRIESELDDGGPPRG